MTLLFPNKIWCIYLILLPNMSVISDLQLLYIFQFFPSCFMKMTGLHGELGDRNKIVSLLNSALFPLLNVICSSLL